ncbi:MAG: restriction endonuclease, partial [bacterium]
EGNCWRKERAYLFDFDPARTLTIYDQFANNLRRDASSSSTEAEREANIRRLLNFFPVLGEDEEGEMVELDPAAVLTIPNRLKSAEVVRRGFMSNLLFADLGNVFGAPAFVREILEKLPFAREEAAKKDKGKLEGMEDIRLDGEGNALPDPERVIGVAHDLFGEKIYAELPPEMEKLLSHTEEEEDSAPRFQAVGNALKEKLAEEFIPAVAEGYGMTGRAQKRMEAGANREIDAVLRNIEEGYNLKKRQAEAALELKKAAAQTEEETRRAEAGYRAELREIGREAQEALTEVAGKTLREKPVALVEEAETQKAESARRAAEDAIRDHLRGFARTIPSFLMAYGDEHTELANFDTYVEDEVFPAVSAITKAEFRLLRDGGDRRDPLTGQVEHFGGHVFNEAVFNASVRAFLEKRRALANYFDESLTEDIFDYIPPQKTNQIFTPRRIVKLMVDKLEEENPGCFDDPEKTFADLYMKSGLYITEIVKRLFRSAGLKAAYPDEKERIRHILTRQVYGMAPTRIIYRIATNFILGFDEALRQEDHNFVLADAAEAAKAGTLAQLVEEHFGE